VMWPTFVFQADYDEIELQKISYDVIFITLPKNVTKITSQNFSISAPLPLIKISGYASASNCVVDWYPIRSWL